MIVWILTIMLVCHWTYQKWLEYDDVKKEIVNLEASIKQHQDNHNQAWKEKLSCIKSCEESWDKQAEKEHEDADNDRARLKELKDTLGFTE